MEIESQSSSATGLTASHAQAIIAWYKQSPIGKKMLLLTEVFRQEWINHRNNHEQIPPNDIERLFGKFLKMSGCVNCCPQNLHISYRCQRPRAA
jgi:hypothetical protein